MSELRSPTESRPNRVYFPNLDGLRFVAFSLVYLQHGFGIGQAAGAGVAFFFVLSGFLITYLLLEELAATGRVNVRAFYIRRALRIWPLYFSVLLFAFVVYPAMKTTLGRSGYIQNGGPLLYLLFLSNFDVLRMPAGEGAGSTNITWSVSIEEQFYLVWPLLIGSVPRRVRGAIFPIVILLSFCFRFANAEDGKLLYFHTFSVISDMAIGGLAAYVWKESPGVRERFSAIPSLLIASIYILAAGALWWTAAFWGPVARVVAATLFAFVVLEQNFCAHSLFKMSRFPLVSELGRYTYGLYMLHMVVLTLQTKMADLLGLEQHAAWRFVSPLLGLLLSIALARMSFLYFEQPFLRLKDRFSQLPTRA